MNIILGSICIVLFVVSYAYAKYRQGRLHRSLYILLLIGSGYTLLLALYKLAQLRSMMGTIHHIV